MTNMLLSRVSIRRDVALSSLLSVLIQDDKTVAPMAGKALMWAAFDTAGEAPRDFLWREAGNGVFYTVSARAPIDAQGLFQIDESLPIMDDLAPGTELAFSLRANPVVRIARPDGKTSKHDVMMNALKDTPSGSRAEVRTDLGRTAALAWLARQGGTHGFTIIEDEVVIVGTRQHEFKKADANTVQYTAVDFQGRLTVTDPEKFREVLASGLGAAKAYGCGLMMVAKTE